LLEGVVVQMADFLVQRAGGEYDFGGAVQPDGGQGAIPCREDPVFGVLDQSLQTVGVRIGLGGSADRFIGCLKLLGQALIALGFWSRRQRVASDRASHSRPTAMPSTPATIAAVTGFPSSDREQD
jgi:hypothetical protein